MYFVGGLFSKKKYDAGAVREYGPAVQAGESSVHFAVRGNGHRGKDHFKQEKIRHHQNGRNRK